VVINAGKKTIEDQQYKGDEGIGKEFFMIEELRNDQVGIDIIKSDDEYAVHDKKSGKISFRKERIVPLSRPGVKDEGQQQETGPGRDMDDNLYGNFFQDGLLSLY
jgi:hypothetical protein